MGVAGTRKGENVADRERTALLDQMYDFGQEHGGMWNVSPETGRFFHFMLQVMVARRVLEIGTSNGYSTLWLVDALEKTGGWLTTLEQDEKKVEMATENLEKAELKERVEIIHGDARETIEDLDKRFDFIFIDADKESYVHYLTHALRLVRPGGVIVADNVESHASELGEFLAMIEKDPWLEDVRLPFGGGQVMMYVRPGR
ncbi:MAG: O-methyltransferase [Sphaerobacteraceae bacterium]|nr:MAG: O-methyltransferase [Sphaerobacteraceae bacterium]